MATREAVGWKLSLEGASPSCPQQCEWVRCLQLRSRAGRVLSVCRSRLSNAPMPGVGRHSELSAEVGVQNCRRLPCPSQGQPFPLSPHGPPWQRELSFCCWVPGKGLQPLQLQGQGEGRKRELCIKMTPPLPLLPDPGLARSGAPR